MSHTAEGAANPGAGRGQLRVRACGMDRPAPTSPGGVFRAIPGDAVTETILLAALLGAFAGLAPGPYTTMVAGTGLERGFRAALPLAFVPLVSDVPPLIITALVLDTLPDALLSVLAALGGAVVVYIGVRFLRLRRGGPAGEASPLRRTLPQAAPFWHVATGTLLSPMPWLFWLVIGSPLLLRSWAESAAEGLLFGVNISTATALAWAACRTRRLIAPRWRYRVLGGILIGAGSLLILEAATGDFGSAIDRQGSIRDSLESRLWLP